MDYLTLLLPQVGPDKAQEEVRYQALLAGKSLVVPTPRLSG